MGSWLLWNFTPGLPAFGGPVAFVSGCILDVGTACAAACEGQSLALDPHSSVYCVTWVNYFIPSVFSVFTKSYPPHWAPVRFLNICEVLSTTLDS